ncbi:hypothetical protein N9284_02775 [Halieaceae bacterium]|nr:hypothetical protein [Halieaceae bacterium]
MAKEKSNILAVLLDVKERNNLEVDDKLIEQCYQLHKKFQYDPKRNTVGLMKDLVESSLDITNEEAGS